MSGSARHAEILRELERARPALEAAGAAVERDLAGLLGGRLKVHSIGWRVKSAESLAGKLARPDRRYESLWDVTDLLGVRVITYFEDGVDVAAELLEASLPLALEHSIDKRRRADPGAFGYRSLHYVCRLGERAPGLPDEARFEVQLRTVLEHAWAEIEHDLGYKSRDAVPAAMRRRLHRLAGLLELADQEFLAIRENLERYAAALPARIESEGDSVPLDPVSVVPLLDCAEVRGVDVAIASALGKPLGDEPFFPEYLARMLVESGLPTAGDARRAMAAHAGAITAMVEPYFAFAWDEWELSPDRMSAILRGYSLFFLAHARVLESASLRLDKVERLARLYRALDYPDDERAAARVASRLVDAFAGALSSR